MYSSGEQNNRASCQLVDLKHVTEHTQAIWTFYSTLAHLRRFKHCVKKIQAEVANTEIAEIATAALKEVTAHAVNYHEIRYL